MQPFSFGAVVLKPRVRPWLGSLGYLETAERGFLLVNPKMEENRSGRSAQRKEGCSSTAVRKYEHRKKTENSTYKCNVGPSYPAIEFYGSFNIIIENREHSRTKTKTDRNWRSRQTHQQM